jgi:uncharacterized membrane protein YfcA
MRAYYLFAMIFTLIFLGAAILAGGIASVAGFGIGSIMTPTLAAKLGTKLAVAAISIPHLAGTAFRFALIREHVNKRVLLGFGIASAIGGLAGALLHTSFSNVVLSYVLGALLIFAGLTGITGLASRMRFSGITAWFAGAASGIFGGLVGNQGGIRSAALLGFDLEKNPSSLPRPPSLSWWMLPVCRFISSPRRMISRESGNTSLSEQSAFSLELS